jgi:Nif-specific regulatory protein
MPHADGIEAKMRKLDEISLLFSISQIIDQSLDIKQVITPVLQELADQLNIARGSITLLDRKTGEIFIEAAHGLSTDEKQRGRYRLGEGITGKVVQTGQSMMIPRISESAEFLNRTGSRKLNPENELAFICVPIKIGNETIGAFSLDTETAPQDQLGEKVRLLTIICSMIAQAVKIRQQAMEEKRLLQEENSRLQEELRERYRPSNIIGNSKAMQDVYDTIAQVSKGDVSVLVRGEAGTGKELVAQAIHYNSQRAARPFTKIKCSGFPELTLEQDLFGSEREGGGPAGVRKGRLELANGGTIFLDEVAALSPGTQARLLRLLTEKEFERVGGTETVRANVRIVAASASDLEDMVATGEFSAELFHRLNLFNILLPALRDRKSDIVLLADHFVERIARENMKTVRRISTPAIDLLMAYHWPGNVRELENCIERAVLLTTDEVIHGHHLPPSLQSAESTDTRLNETLEEALDKLELELLRDALKSTKGNMSKASRLLGLTERKMGLRIEKYQIDPRQFR